MYEILIVIHAFITLALIIVILMQRSSSDGTGGLSGSSSGGGLVSSRTAANLLTRTTAILATAFIALSLGIGVLTTHNNKQAPNSILEKIESKSGELKAGEVKDGEAKTGEKPALTIPSEPVKTSVPRPE
jgi:preprotein translocase subunit SecG